jgi:hypothetical protein
MNVTYVSINTQLISFLNLLWSSISALPGTGLKDPSLFLMFQRETQNSVAGNILPANYGLATLL